MSDTSLSEEARLFLRRNAASDQSTLPDASNIGFLRKQAREEYRRAFESAQNKHTQSIQDVSIGGVDCMQINPKYRDQKKGDVVMLYLFGGGYILGSPEEDLPISAAISNKLGIRSICPRYRLAPEHPFPAALEDASAVYRALLDEHDNGHIVVVGESAGGHLALQTTLRASTDGIRLPTACALLSPWADISMSGDSVDFNDGRDPTLSVSLVARAAQMFAPNVNHCDQTVSPLFADYSMGFPPTFISTGTRDLLMSSAIRLATKMRHANIEVTLTVVYPEVCNLFL